MRLYVRLSCEALTDGRILDAGPEAAFVWVRGLLYAKAHLTDGAIPRGALPMLTIGTIQAPDAIVARLVDSGLWNTTADGWEVGVEKWARYQVTSAEVAAQRASWRDRQQRKRGVTQDVTRDISAKPRDIGSEAAAETPKNTDVSAQAVNCHADVTRDTKSMSRLCHARVTLPESESESESEVKIAPLPKEGKGESASPPTPVKSRRMNGVKIPTERLTDFAEAWNILATKHRLPTVTLPLNAKRAAALSQRLREHDDEDWWLRVLRAVPSCAFLCGDNERHWRANFDWLLRPSNAEKVLEGFYTPGRE